MSRWRDGLMAAVLPSPGADLPGLEALNLDAFWAQFRASAPRHLRLGLALAVVFVGLLPWGLGYFRPLHRLDADQREAVVSRGDRLPVFGSLLELAKLVACLAYFADPDVQARARGRS